MPEWEFRLAVPEEAEAFAKWALSPLIDPKDRQLAMKANNPTVVTFVAAHNGIPVVYAPVYLGAVLAFLGFNPDATDSAERRQALNLLKDGVSAFMVQWGIRQLETLTKEQYPVARWARTKGFEPESRTPFILDLNKELVEAH